ncbi:hypothetical protein CGRA01v4_08357 [Colletotrichum graminicola]|nr:hypothetical protein CGRA01v4_08357 [Colletotrichum graminicola]
MDDRGSCCGPMPSVCIDQVDLGERSLQVEMMRGIFGSANLLLAWLDTWNQSLAPGALETIANPNGNRAPKCSSFPGLRLA